MSPGISDAELLGIGFGESVGGRDVRDGEDRDIPAGSGKRSAGGGGEPDLSTSYYHDRLTDVTKTGKSFPQPRIILQGFCVMLDGLLWRLTFV